MRATRADRSTTDGVYNHPDVTGIVADGPVSLTSIVDTKIDVTGRGIDSTGGNYTISGGRTEVISRTSAALRAYSAGNFNPEITINDAYFSSQSDPSAKGVLEIADSPDITISGAEVRGDDREGINLENCQAPTVRDCEIYSVRQNGVRIFYDNETSMTIGADDIPAVVKGCEFRDWGLGGSTRAAVRFVLEGATAGQYDTLAAKDNKMRIRPNNVADQRGIHVEGTIDSVGNSDLSGNIMSNVQAEITGGTTLETSVKQDNIVKLA